MPWSWKNVASKNQPEIYQKNIKIFNTVLFCHNLLLDLVYKQKFKYGHGIQREGGVEVNLPQYSSESHALGANNYIHVFVEETDLWPQQQDLFLSEWDGSLHECWVHESVWEFI